MTLAQSNVELTQAAVENQKRFIDTLPEFAPTRAQALQTLGGAVRNHCTAWSHVADAAHLFFQTACEARNRAARDGRMQL
jgi:hypothetical protein